VTDLRARVQPGFQELGERAGFPLRTSLALVHKTRPGHAIARGHAQELLAVYRAAKSQLSGAGNAVREAGRSSTVTATRRARCWLFAMPGTARIHAPTLGFYRAALCLLCGAFVLGAALFVSLIMPS
jgi:hypothetical protein